MFSPRSVTRRSLPPISLRAAPQERGLSVTTSSGRPCRLVSFSRQRSAAALSLRFVTTASSTSPSWPTARHGRPATDGPPRVVPHPVHPHDHLVEGPAPARDRAHPFSSPCLDLRRAHRAEPSPPAAHRLVAHLHAPLVLEVLDVPQQERDAHLKHHRETDDLRAGLEAAKGRAPLSHRAGVGCARARLKRPLRESLPALCLRAETVKRRNPAPG